MLFSSSYTTKPKVLVDNLIHIEKNSGISKGTPILTKELILLNICIFVILKYIKVYLGM